MPGTARPSYQAADPARPVGDDQQGPPAGGDPHPLQQRRQLPGQPGLRVVDQQVGPAGEHHDRGEGPDLLAAGVRLGLGLDLVELDHDGGAGVGVGVGVGVGRRCVALLEGRIGPAMDRVDQGRPLAVDHARAPWPCSPTPARRPARRRRRGPRRPTRRRTGRRSPRAAPASCAQRWPVSHASAAGVRPAPSARSVMRVRRTATVPKRVLKVNGRVPRSWMPRAVAAVTARPGPVGRRRARSGRGTAPAGPPGRRDGRGPRSWRAGARPAAAGGRPGAGSNSTSTACSCCLTGSRATVAWVSSVVRTVEPP